MTRAEQKSAALVAEDGAGIRRSGVNPLRNVIDGDTECKARIMEAAEAFTRNGVPVVPVNPGAKRPAVDGWNDWGRSRHLPRWSTLRGLFDRGDRVANIGILTGERSGLVLVDVDSADDDVLREVVGRFGNTPLIDRTGSGHWHLWYRWNGEGCRNLRGALGLPVDIKGEGGFGIAPPSIHHGTGRPYTLHAGGDLSAFWSLDLPTIEDGAIPAPPPVAADPLRHPNAAIGGMVPVGERHAALLVLLRKACWKHDDAKVAAHEVWSVVQSTFAQVDDGEYGFDEVMRQAVDVLRWCRANAQPRQRRFAKITEDEIRELMDSGRALALLGLLRAKFFGRSVEFPVSPAWLAENEGGIARTWRAARDALIERGLIVVHRKGGRGKNDPAIYRWGARSLAVLPDASKGVMTIPNTDDMTRPPMEARHSAATLNGPTASNGRAETDTLSATFGGVEVTAAGRAA